MMRIKAHKKRGFTLVEVLVYLGILLVASSVAVSVLLSLRFVFERNRIERTLGDTATSILERLVREARDAKSISTISSGVLELTHSPTTTRFYQSGEDVMIRTVVGGVAVSDYALDSTRVAISNLTFASYSAGTTTMVRASFSAKVTGAYASTTENFSTAAVLRGSYE